MIWRSGCRTWYFIVALAASCGARNGAAAGIIPDNPAGRHFKEWLAAFNFGDAKRLEAFSKSHYAKVALDQIPARERAVWDVLTYQDNRVLDLKRLEDSTDYRLVAVVQSRLTGLWLRVTLETERVAPYGITNMGIMFLPTPDAARPRNPMSDAEIAREIDRYITKLADADAFSGVVLVAAKGNPFFTRAGGYADRERKLPNRLDTKFNLASMNKMFTAVAITQLAQQGKLKLTDTVGKLLPDYPNRQVATKVTVHHLLTHTSGLRSYWNARYRATKDSLRRLSDFLPLFASDKLSFEPGARFQYSNNGYIVLGLIIEKVSGQSYDDYVRDHIYRPAGMVNTAFYDTDQAVPNLAVGYTESDATGVPSLGPARPNWPHLGRRGSSAGGGYSTAEDLLRFDVALRNHTLLGPEYTELLFKGKVQRGGSVEYAYGFEDRQAGGQRVVGHGGGFPGVSTQLEMYLDTGYTVVVLTNTNRPGMVAVVQKLNEMLSAPRSQDRTSRTMAIDSLIDVGGYRLQINCSPNVPGRPTVVLEAGMTQSSATWSSVQPEIAKFARVCAYDRAGLGKSELAPESPRTSLHIVADLHRLLDRAGIAGPYVLVGHSLGGLHVRLYASKYPGEVVGLVLVDGVSEEQGAKWLAMMPAEIRKELEAAGGRMPMGNEIIDVEESERLMRAAEWHTDVPMIVLSRGRASYDPEDYPPPLRFLAPQGEQLRIEMQQQLARQSSRGEQLFAERSGHMIQQDEPEVVIDAVRRVVDRAARTR